MTPPPPAAPPRVYLVRHGETEWTLSGRHTSTTDLPLTAHGESEARALAPWLAPVEFSHVFVSPRLRARQTCEQAGLAATAEIEPDLVEWDYGVYEGESSKDIGKTRAGWSLFGDGAPGGESPEDIRIRADRLIERLLGLSGNIALFSHGQFSSAFATRWIQLPVAEARHLALSTASLSILSFAPTHPDVRVLSLWNATPAVLGGG
jgi:probable phosphoglycerate mutase